jgi:hypothetical protein
MPSLGWESSDVDWGTVPTWIAGVAGGISLVLALSIFLRDHINAERAQVDRIGPSRKVSYPWRALDVPELAAQATAEFTVRNASDLPVHVAQLAFVLRTKWAVLDTDQPAVKSGALDVWTPVPGTDAFWSIFAPFDVAPQEVWTSGPKEQDLSHLAPEGATQLWLGGDGVKCDIAWMLIRDNAGRRWEVRPGIARRAKRIRWYSRAKEFQPPLWFSPLGRRFAVLRSRVRLTSD